MSVFDRFLNSIKLNDDDDLEEDDYFDEEDDELDDSAPARRFFSRDEDDDEPVFEEDASAVKKQKNASRQTSVKQPRRFRNSSQQNASQKVSAFRPRKAAAPEEEVERNNFSVCVVRPKSMEDALQIAQMLIAHCVVILNLEGLALDVSQRVFDFASGACCASRGRLDKISNYIFVLTPHDVDITGEFQKILTGTFDPNLDIDLDEDL